MGIGAALTDDERAVCRLWRPAVCFAGERLGIYPQRNAVVLLNPSAAIVWDGLAGGDALERIAERVAGETAMPAEGVRSSISGVIAGWRKTGFFRAPATPPPPAGGLPVDRPPAPSLERTLAAGAAAVRLAVDDAAVAAALSDMLGDFPSAPRADHDLLVTGTTSGPFAVLVDGECVRAGLAPAPARGNAVMRLIRLAGGEEGWLALLHAAVVTRGPHTFLLTGPGGSGKTTLAAALIARGFRLVAEDTAPLDREGRVHPLPFRLSLKAGSWPLVHRFGIATRGLRRHALDPRALVYAPLDPSRRAASPVRPTAVLSLARGRGEAAGIRPLSPLEALAHFLDEASFIDFAAAEALDFLRRFEALPAFRLTYDDAVEAAVLLENLAPALYVAGGPDGA